MNRATASRQPAGRATPRALRSRPFGDHQAHGEGHEVAQAFRAHPDIAGVRRRDPDEYIPRTTWTVWLPGAWRVSDSGHGDTIEQAYQDALANRAKLEAA